MCGVREVKKLSGPHSKGVLLCFKKNGFHPFISKFAIIAALIDYSRNILLLIDCKYLNWLDYCLFKGPDPLPSAQTRWWKNRVQLSCACIVLGITHNGLHSVNIVGWQIMFNPKHPPQLEFSRAIVSVMKSFEKFMFSFGHAKFANPNNARRAFNVLESNDTDVVQCPLLGESKFNNKCIALGCERMISVEYLQTGVISKLTEVFCSIGLTAQWDERENCGNPALTCQVTSNFKMVQNQQAKAGVSQRQAAFFLSNQLQHFFLWLAVLLFALRE